MMIVFVLYMKKISDRKVEPGRFYLNKYCKTNHTVNCLRCFLSSGHPTHVACRVGTRAVAHVYVEDTLQDLLAAGCHEAFVC